MQVIRADALGLCFGVRDALRVARAVAQPAEVTIHGELVHNPAVQDELRARGFATTGEGQRNGSSATPRVLVTAHGISERERGRLLAAGKELVDTTCPLVARVHEAARRLERAGYHVLVVGRRGHVEVRGIVEDLARYEVLEGPEEVRPYPSERLGLVSQTTATERTVAAVHAAVVAQNPDAEVRLVDTVCTPTKERQTALERLLDRVDALVVVGGRNSNNTRQLVERGRARGLSAFHVERPGDLRPEWFRGCAAVGLTAGTSTPEEQVAAVESALADLGASRPA